MIITQWEQEIMAYKYTYRLVIIKVFSLCAANANSTTIIACAYDDRSNCSQLSSDNKFKQTVNMMKLVQFVRFKYSTK